MSRRVENAPHMRHYIHNYCCEAHRGRHNLSMDVVCMLSGLGDRLVWMFVDYQVIPRAIWMPIADTVALYSIDTDDCARWLQRLDARVSRTDDDIVLLNTNWHRSHECQMRLRSWMTNSHGGSLTVFGG